MNAATTIKHITLFILLNTTIGYAQTPILEKGQDISIEFIQELNSVASDFAPFLLNDQLIFTSTRVNSVPILNKDPETGEAFTDIFSYSLLKKTVELFDPAFQSKLHDGTLILGPKEAGYLYTQSNPKAKAHDGKFQLSIVGAQGSPGNWNINELNINLPKYHTCHPAYLPAQKLLLFSSDRPGGIGGMDLWMSTFNGLYWSPPVNCGDQINTKNNEIFPSFDPVGNLFWSSDRKGGNGGLDIYCIQKYAGIKSSNINIILLPQPINSSNDDFGICFSPDLKSGYFTSDRPGSMAKDNIYQWKIYSSQGSLQQPIASSGKYKKKIIRISDHLTHLPIEKVQCTFLDRNGSEIYRGETLSDGHIEVILPELEEIMFQMDKPGFRSIALNKTVPVDSILHMELENDQLVTMRGHLMDEDGKFLNMKEVICVPVDANGQGHTITGVDGTFTFYMYCTSDYKLFVKNNQYLDSFLINKSDLKCGPTPKLDKFFILKKRTNIEKPIVITQSTQFEKGKTYLLEGIYYAFDSYELLPESKITLNNLIDILQSNPSWRIELSSHTDNRGSESYNLQLSQKRAQSVVDYLTKFGIQKTRLLPRGYGESNPVIECNDYLPCSETDHALNRRTEFKIL